MTGSESLSKAMRVGYHIRISTVCKPRNQGALKRAARERCKKALRRFPMTFLRSTLPIFMLFAGCGQIPTPITPYKMDIQQGNVITQEMLAKLKPGMTPSQVRFILGTPLVVDPFRKDRWDYIYRYSKGGTVQEQRRIVVVFQDQKLARIEGDVIPAQQSGGSESGVKIDKPAPQAVESTRADPGASSPKPEVTTASQPEGITPSAPALDPVTSGNAEKGATPGQETGAKEEK